ncbi:MAG: hypothetical protein ACFCU3_08935 [Verrucomicrobiales bacterium]
MAAEFISYQGWDKVLHLNHHDLELYIPQAVGPRITGLSFRGSKNLFKEYSEQLGGHGEDEWLIRGGHRLWMAPEDEVLTYDLDNSEVRITENNESDVTITGSPGPQAGLMKELQLTFHASSPGLRVLHRLHNTSERPQNYAAWALSVMAAGAQAILPEPPLGEHPRDLLPDRSLILWPYTRLNDRRLSMGTKFLRWHQADEGQPFKFGVFRPLGWVAVWLHGVLLLKGWDQDPLASYPDFGCSFETFTNHEMLEIETLSPLRSVHPGESTDLVEHWLLAQPSSPPPEEEDALEAWLQPHLAQLQQIREALA